MIFLQSVAGRPAIPPGALSLPWATNGASGTCWLRLD